MFDYDYNGEQKHTMLIGQLRHNHYIVNILYEDFEGSDEKFVISGNLRDFFDDNETVEKIKTILRKILNENLEKKYMDVKWNIPKWIQKTILDKFNRL